MKALLNNTTSIVAASLALGISTAAVAQNSTVQMTGDISFGGTGYSAEDDNTFSMNDWEQTGGLDLSFDVMAEAPEQGVAIFGHADLSAAADGSDFNNMMVSLDSAAIGISGEQGALMARIGSRETAHAYAGDLAVGSAGATTKFLDEMDDSWSIFNGIELIYANAQGPVSFSGSYEPETGKISGAAGYDSVTMYGPSRINVYAFEDTLNNAEDVFDAVRGYRVAGFVNNGVLELGGSVAIEDIEYAGDSKSERISYGFGAVMMVNEGFDISVDYEQSETSVDGTSTESTILSLGAEMAFGDALTIGGHMTQYTDTPVLALAGNTVTTTNKSGSEVGLNIGISF